MKSIKTISLSTAALMALVVGGIGVNAATGSGSGTTDNNIADGSTGAGFVAEDSASAKSTAEFAVTAGKLTLDAVPDMQFGNAGVSDIATKDIATKNVVLTYQDGKVTDKKDSEGNVTAKDTNDGNDAGLIRVSDFRGSGAGWKLSLGLSAFSNGSDTLGGTTLAIALGDKKDAVGIASSTDGTASTPIYVAATDTGMGVNDFTIDGDTELQIAKNPKVKSGTYQADLTWTLSNTPTTKAAS